MVVGLNCDNQPAYCTWNESLHPVMNGVHSLSAWIDHVFDHPVTELELAWDFSTDAPTWKGTGEQTVRFVAETFERSGEVLAGFTDAQLNQGFWYLLSICRSEQMVALTSEEVPLPLRLRALRSFVPLFEQVMAPRCSPHLSHLDERPANPLNSACYMWWDILPICGEPSKPDRAEFDAEVMQVLGRLLEIPHDACRESALHGLGEWQVFYPDIARIIDEWLARTPKLRPELIAYARQAREGYIQ
jgi:hypothetical protein